MRYVLCLSVLMISISSFGQSTEVDGAQLIDPPIVQELASQVTPLKESEIPVLAAAKNKKSEVKSSSGRVVLSMLVIALLAGGMLYFSRWYGKNNKAKDETTRIRVLGQHFLGPRKSLAIVRVAGETILIGVTDQNISMLKSLSLIDDEFPEAVPNSFAKTLATADEDVDDFVISSVKDKVSAKIKNLRNI